MLEAGVLRELLERAGPSVGRVSAPTLPIEPTWRERLWTAPGETRIGVKELAEAMGRPRSWVYRRTAPNGERALLPHRKLDGELVFAIEEIRCWVREHETEITPLVRPAGARAT
jgi:hypothetical protein